MNKFTTEDNDVDDVYYTVFFGKAPSADDILNERTLVVGVS